LFIVLLFLCDRAVFGLVYIHRVVRAPLAAEGGVRVGRVHLLHVALQRELALEHVAALVAHVFFYALFKRCPVRWRVQLWRPAGGGHLPLVAAAAARVAYVGGGAAVYGRVPASGTTVGDVDPVAGWAGGGAYQGCAGHTGRAGSNNGIPAGPERARPFPLVGPAEPDLVEAVQALPAVLAEQAALAIPAALSPWTRRGSRGQRLHGGKYGLF